MWIWIFHSRRKYYGEIWEKTEKEFYPGENCGVVYGLGGVFVNENKLDPMKYK